MKNSEKNLPSDGIFKTLQECADYGNVGRQAIYCAIKIRRLKATKNGKNWSIKCSDYEDYRLNKFNRSLKVRDGVHIYDAEAGRFTPTQACQLLQHLLNRPFPKAKIYYEMRLGRLESVKNSAAYVVHRQAIETYVAEIKAQEEVEKQFRFA